jgi:hypothetical protein
MIVRLIGRCVYALINAAVWIVILCAAATFFEAMN